MKKKYFGTDGIRGTVNIGNINGEKFFKFGLAAGTYFKNLKKRKQIAIIAKDTRLSGYTLEPALVSGLASAGMHIFTLGPLPTNGLAMLTKKMKANLGIMITASHNPFHDNGLKLFGPDGMKLSDKIEKKIENLIDTKTINQLSEPRSQVLKKNVKKFKADLGIALDGDADRVIMCDEKSKLIDGDQIIAMIAKRWKRKKILKGGVIGTLMSNYGLEKFFLKEKISFKRSKVGDRYVKEMMKKNNYNLGGEQSGHIILGRFATTGDGLLVALETLFALRKGKLASEILKVYKPVPQKLLNIQVKDKKIINTPKCKKAIKLANQLIKNEGRLLVRPSGTEPKIRIMCESFNQSLMIKCINLIKTTIH